MDSKTLRKLERHAQAAGEIIINDVINSAADTLADDTADPRDSLSALAIGAVLLRIALESRTIRATQE